MPIFNPLDAYNDGLQGSRVDPRADEMLVDLVMRTGGDADGGRVAYNWGLEGAAKDKLSLIFPYVEQCYPGAFPGPAQLWGDCTAAAAIRAALGSLCVEAVLGKPDEETGHAEEAPDVSEIARKNAVIAQESVFAYRGFSDDGWSCAAAAQTIMEKGFLLRQNYPDLGIDLTKYTESTIRIGGAKHPGPAFEAASKKHRVRTVTVINDVSAIGDYIASGFAVVFCHSLKWSSTRNEDGYSPVVPGEWLHSQSIQGWDARPVTIKKYGEPLALVLNQWAKWNTGPRRIPGTDIDIPGGSFWTKSSAFKRARCIAYSSILGWPRKKLPNYGFAGNI